MAHQSQNMHVVLLLTLLAQNGPQRDMHNMETWIMNPTTRMLAPQKVMGKEDKEKNNSGWQKINNRKRTYLVGAYIRVNLRALHGRLRVNIYFNGTHFTVGSFATAEETAKAFDVERRKLDPRKSKPGTQRPKLNFARAPLPNTLYSQEQQPK